MSKPEITTTKQLAKLKQQIRNGERMSTGYQTDDEEIPCKELFFCNREDYSECPRVLMGQVLGIEIPGPDWDTDPSHYGYFIACKGAAKCDWVITLTPKKE